MFAAADIWLHSFLIFCFSSTYTSFQNSFSSHCRNCYHNLILTISTPQKSISMFEAHIYYETPILDWISSECSVIISWKTVNVLRNVFVSVSNNMQSYYLLICLPLKAKHCFIWCWGIYRSHITSLALLKWLVNCVSFYGKCIPVHSQCYVSRIKARHWII